MNNRCAVRVVATTSTLATFVFAKALGGLLREIAGRIAHGVGRAER